MSTARLLFALIFAFVACGPSMGPEDARGGKGLCSTAAICEESIVKASIADVERLVAAYAKLTGEPGWNALLASMREAGPLVVHDAGFSPKAPLRGVALPARPTKIAVERLLLAFGRGAGRDHLFVHVGGVFRQLFPNDAIEPFVAGLDPVIAAEPPRVAADLALAKSVHATISAAKAFDYPAAASRADELRRAVRGEGSVEARWRARVALRALELASLVLDHDEELEPLEAPSAPGTTPYAALLAVLLHGERAPAFAARRAHILEGLAPERAAALEVAFAEPGACPKPVVPPMESLGDLFFGNQLAAALDAEAGPGEKAAPGKLALDAWLPRYAAMVRLVDEGGHAWSHLATLIGQRGELHGLSAATTPSYRRVSELGKQHLDALTALADAHPTRFTSGALLDLTYRPGLLHDLGLREAVGSLLRKTVFTRVAGAESEGELLESAAAAFAAGTSFPGPLQGAQLNALSMALDEKLGGAFGQKKGWPMAGLHAGHALFNAVLGATGWLDRGASRIAASLDGDVSEPSLAELAGAIARYAALGGQGGLDPDVANPRLFPPARSEARERLRAAIEGLAEGGPASPPEKELALLLTDLGDASIALGAAEVRGMMTDAAPRCEGAERPLEGAYERARKKRRTLLAHPAFKSPTGRWALRARLVGLVLSDALDVADPKEGFTLPHAEAERVVEAGLEGWLEGGAAELAAGGYLLVRGAIDPDENAAVAREAVRVLAALADLFGEESGSLFAVLARVGKEVDVERAGGDVARLLARYADRAYAAGSHDHGDLFLMIALGGALARKDPVPAEAVAVAKSHARPVLLPLTMYDATAHEGGDPTPLVEAMRAAVKGNCRAPDPSLVFAVRQASYRFRSGEREPGLAALERALDEAERQGLVVPRQAFQYQQHAGEKIFNAQQSVSLGSHLLENAGTFQIGLGYQTKAEHRGSMTVTFASTDTVDAKKEAARYYAHAAALTSSYAFAMGQDARARAAARRAIDTWATGVRLGEIRVPVAGETTTWAKDATATLAIVAQQAAEAGHALLAGDLFTLLRASVAPTASDDDVAKILDPLPPYLRGVPEIEAVASRARESLAIVGGSLACTKKKGRPQDHVRVSCERYPLSLALRVADVLTEMPRLEKAASVGKPDCVVWKELDAFLATVAEQRYEPDLLLSTVATLRKLGHPSDAATLLARQRHPAHCGPSVVGAARELARDETLGAHLRADLLSVAANCDSASPALLDDLKALDALTQRHALPLRNLELVIFATSIALTDDRWEPLYQLASAPDFVKRWQRIGPDLGTAALLVAHAAAVGRGVPVDRDGSAPYYRLLCTTFAEKKRGTMCSAIALLRDESQSEHKEIAKKALREFAEQAIAALRPDAPGP
jgi:hypothetical protein